MTRTSRWAYVVIWPKRSAAMDIKKLFHVLVMGGAILGGASGCGGGDKNPNASGNPSTTGPGTGTSDGGSDDGGGGGTHGW